MIRLLYGWKKTEDRIASSQISALTGIHDRDVRAILDELVELRMLDAKKEAGKATLWRIQKDFDQWQTPRVRTPGSPHASACQHPGVSTPGTPRVDTPGTPRVYTRHQIKKDTSKETPAGQAAVAAFCDAYLAARGTKYAPDPAECKWLKGRVSQVGLEAFKALLPHFFALKENWVASQAWNVAALRARFQACHSRAQAHAKARELQAKIDAQPEPDLKLLEGFKL